MPLLKSPEYYLIGWNPEWTWGDSNPGPPQCDWYRGFVRYGHWLFMVVQVLYNHQIWGSQRPRSP